MAWATADLRSAKHGNVPDWKMSVVGFLVEEDSQPLRGYSSSRY